MATTATLLQGIGEVDDAEVEELKILAEVVSGRPPRPIKLRVFALRSAERTGKGESKSRMIMSKCLGTKSKNSLIKLTREKFKEIFR